MKYEEWSYQNLLNLRDQLEEAIREGQPLKVVLHVVNKEMADRKFALVAMVGGRIRKEYGRWKTKEKCEHQASEMGLPVGGNFEVEGQKFETVVVEF